MATVRSGGTGYPFKFPAGDDIGGILIAIGNDFGRVHIFKTGGQNDGPDFIF